MLQAKDVTHYFGGLCAVSQFNLDLMDGELVGIIGPNGAGKTTIFNLITGVYRATKGSIVLNGADSAGGTELVGTTPNQITRLGVRAHLPDDPPVQRYDRAGQCPHGPLFAGRL